MHEIINSSAAFLKIKLSGFSNRHSYHKHKNVDAVKVLIAIRSFKQTIKNGNDDDPIVIKSYSY